MSHSHWHRGLLAIPVVSFSLSKYFLHKKNEIIVNTKSHTVQISGIWGSTSYNFNSSNDFESKTSFIGSQFQVHTETLIFKDTSGKTHKIISYMMPMDNGFQTIIEAIKKLEMEPL